jgi:glycosyltransferase involved in cell wall biosynthesis
MAENGVRVLLVLGSSAGGVARHVAQVGAALAAAVPEGPGMLVQVAGPRGLAGQVAPAGGAVSFHAVPIRDRPHLGDVQVVHRLRRLALGADVVHAHGLRAGALVVLAAGAIPQERRPRIVVTLHNLPVGRPAVRTVSAVLERVVARGADVVLGVSGDLVLRAQALGARQSARALVPAPERPPTRRSPAQVRASLGVPEGAALVVTVARLAAQKGLDTLCDTAALVKARLAAGDLPQITGLTWVVAGEGPLKAYLAGRIRDEGLPIVALGQRDDVPDLLAAADLVVSTAVWEGQPIWLQEAMKLGAAIVATDVGGTIEVTADGASLVPVADPSRTTGRIVHLLSDTPRRRALGEAARERARELPTIVDVVAQLTDVYKA